MIRILRSLMCLAVCTCRAEHFAVPNITCRPAVDGLDDVAQEATITIIFALQGRRQAVDHPNRTNDVKIKEAVMISSGGKGRTPWRHEIGHTCHALAL